MKLIATRKGEQNSAVLDPWTFVHFAAGLAAGLMALPRDWSVAGAVAYEMVEQYAERQRWGQDVFETTREESVPNAVVDVIVFAVGHRCGEVWNRTSRRR
jgi:hypothetical protein